MISYKDNIERCLCGGLKVNGKCTRCERNKEAEKKIEDIEKIVNLRGDYEEVDVDYIDCNGEMKTLTGTPEYELLNYITRLQEENEKLNHILNTLEEGLEKEIADYQDVESEDLLAMVQEDKYILFWLKLKKGDDNK